MQGCCFYITLYLAERLAVLPAALRSQFSEALTTLDSQRIEDSIRQITAIDAELGMNLGELVECFDYPTILAALDAENIQKN
jgi:hypothetical protein